MDAMASQITGVLYAHPFVWAQVKKTPKQGNNITRLQKDII